MRGVAGIVPLEEIKRTQSAAWPWLIYYALAVAHAGGLPAIPVSTHSLITSAVYGMSSGLLPIWLDRCWRQFSLFHIRDRHRSGQFTTFLQGCKAFGLPHCIRQIVAGSGPV